MNTMEKLIYTNGKYQTDLKKRSFFSKVNPSLPFYWKLIRIVFKASVKAKRHEYDGDDWSRSSLEVLQALESVGVRFEIRGVEYVRQLESPCVFIANHMSTLETMILPAIIQPLKAVTFVVKQSLIDYPVFKHIMRSRNPIVVNRKHPRQDFRTVLGGGVERLQTGMSIIVFPQTTRTPSFDPAQFNTIGIKLAKKARTPIIPITLVTDVWGNGRYIKDFGKIDPSRKVFFIFGKPMWIQGQGSKEHAEILDFIHTTLQNLRSKE